MNGKSTLEEMRSFYQKLDSALAQYSCFRKDHATRPISVGGDAVYLVAEERLGSVNEIIRACEKRFWSLLNKQAAKKVDKDAARYMGVLRPMFGDADFYLTDPENLTWVHKALEGMGYIGNIKDVSREGCAVFSKKDAYPSKVELMANLGRGHLRPKSKKPIETILPYGEGCTTELEGLGNLAFITPQCFRQRIINDIKFEFKNGDKIPLKMLEDIVFIGAFLKEEGLSIVNGLVKSR